MEERKQFTFYQSFLKVAKMLNSANAGKFLMAVCEYGLYGTTTQELKGEARATFEAVIPVLDSGRKKAAAGKAGGERKPKQPETKPEGRASKEKTEKPDMAWASDGIKDAVNRWIAYKQERREGYKPTGLKAMLTQIQNRVRDHGEAAVIEVIELSMASGWKGICWEKIEHQEKKPAVPGNGSAREMAKAMTDRVNAGTAGLGSYEKAAIQRMLDEARRSGEAAVCEDCNHKPCTEAQRVKCCAACQGFLTCTTRCERATTGSDAMFGGKGNER